MYNGSGKCHPSVMFSGRMPPRKVIHPDIMPSNKSNAAWIQLYYGNWNCVSCLCFRTNKINVCLKKASPKSNKARVQQHMVILSSELSAATLSVIVRRSVHFGASRPWPLICWIQNISQTRGPQHSHVHQIWWPRVLSFFLKTFYRAQNTIFCLLTGKQMVLLCPRRKHVDN